MMPFLSSLGSSSYLVYNFPAHVARALQPSEELFDKPRRGAYQVWAGVEPEVTLFISVKRSCRGGNSPREPANFSKTV